MGWWRYDGGRQRTDDGGRRTSNIERPTSNIEWKKTEIRGRRPEIRKMPSMTITDHPGRRGEKAESRFLPRTPDE
jgi:hypothetical protein